MKHIMFLLILVTSIACSTEEQRTIQLLSSNEKAIVYLPPIYNIGDTVVVYYDYPYNEYSYATNWLPFETETMVSNDSTMIYHKAVIIK